MGKPIVPNPSNPIAGQSPATVPWMGFFRNLAANSGVIPQDDPTQTPASVGGATIFGGHFYVCVVDDSWSLVL